MGIDPPRGVLLHGPPGTGKTMMAKAVANATSATFISVRRSASLRGTAAYCCSRLQVVASEFVQKYLGEGPRMVRDVFRLAREKPPAIIFIDEVCFRVLVMRRLSHLLCLCPLPIDAVGTKRFDSQTGADREVQRILLELLTQMDGFDQQTNVKVRPSTVVVAVGLLIRVYRCR